MGGRLGWESYPPVHVNVPYAAPYSPRPEPVARVLPFFFALGRMPYSFYRVWLPAADSWSAAYYPSPTSTLNEAFI